MLYLPPQIAHDGVALDACITCSIGFRAPLLQEIAEAFVDHLRDSIDIPGRYGDPDLRPSRHPARIDRVLRSGFAEAIDGIDLSRREVGERLPLSSYEARMLIAEGWAEPVAAEEKRDPDVDR